jgi:hypothetical protein
MGADITKIETFFGREQFHGLALGMSKKQVEAASGRPLEQTNRDQRCVYFAHRAKLDGHTFETEHLELSAVFTDDKLAEASLIIAVGDKAAEAAVAKLVNAEAKKRWGKGEEGRGAAVRSWAAGGGKVSLLRWKEKTPEDLWSEEAPEVIYHLKLALDPQ